MMRSGLDRGAPEVGQLGTTPVGSRFELQVATGAHGQLATAWMWLAIWLFALPLFWFRII